MGKSHARFSPSERHGGQQISRLAQLDRIPSADPQHGTSSSRERPVRGSRHSPESWRFTTPDGPRSRVVLHDDGPASFVASWTR